MNSTLNNYGCASARAVTVNLGETGDAVSFRVGERIP
jgi:hypothetical protein